jgi:hypothetical protein
MLERAAALVTSTLKVEYANVLEHDPAAARATYRAVLRLAARVGR